MQGPPPTCLDNTRARRAAGRCVLWGTPESAARPWDATLLLDGQTLDRQRGALHVTMADGRIACCCCLALGGGGQKTIDTRAPCASLTVAFVGDFDGRIASRVPSGMMGRYELGR